MASETISKLEDRLARQVEERNAQIDDLRNALAEVSAKLRETIARDGALALRVDALERVPVPGFLGIWGPAVASAALLATGFGFILDQRDKPIANEIATLKHEQRDVNNDLRAVSENQFEFNRELGEIRTETRELRRQVASIDAKGARARED